MGSSRDDSRDKHRVTLTGEEIIEGTKKHAIIVWGKVLPFGAQVVASAAAYSVGITATQLVGFVCKVSCATPVLGPTMGLLGVGLANVLAGQASKHTRKMVVTKSHPLQPGFWEMPDPADVALDAVMGACIFKALGGRFSSVMPSDLTKPGALSYESIPARADKSEAYAQPSVKRELARIFKRDGCHHCGSRKPPVIGDHMPPNKLLQGSRDQLGKWMADIPVVGKVYEVMVGGRKRGPLQRFYPQCQRCSIKQATAVRNGKRVLVLHLHWPRLNRGDTLAGVFVGLRYNAPDLGRPSGGDYRRRSGKWASLTLATPPALDMPRVVHVMSPAPEGSAFSLQQLPHALCSEASNSSMHRGWSSSNTTGSSHFLQVTPLTDGSPGPAGASAGTTVWQYQQQQQQQQDHHQQQQAALSTASRGSSPAGYLAPQASAFSAYGLNRPGSTGGSKAGSGKGAALHNGMNLMQHAQQRQRGLSGHGDEAARLLDQNRAQQGFAPEYAKARAEAAFERHFAPGLTH